MSNQRRQARTYTHEELQGGLQQGNLSDVSFVAVDSPAEMDQFESLHAKLHDSDREKKYLAAQLAQSKKDHSLLEKRLARTDQNKHESFTKSMENFVDQQAVLVENQQDILNRQTMQRHQVPKFTGKGEPFVEDWIERVLFIQRARRWDDYVQRCKISVGRAGIL